MMAFAQRRSKCEGARDVGTWTKVMSMLSILGIPMNCAIIYFTGDSNWIKRDGQSSFVKWLNTNETL